MDLPLCNVWLPIAASYLLVEARLLVNIILSSQARPVSLDLLALGESFRPLRVGLKAGLIDVGRDVTSNARVDVLEPRTTLSRYSAMAEEIKGQIKRGKEAELILRLTTSAFFSRMVSFSPGTLRGNKLPASTPARPAPITTTCQVQPQFTSIGAVLGAYFEIAVLINRMFADFEIGRIRINPFLSLLFRLGYRLQ